MFNQKQDKRFIHVHSIKQVKRLGFEPDAFIKSALANRLELLLDTRTGTIIAGWPV